MGIKNCLLLTVCLISTYSFGSELSFNLASAYYVPSYEGYKADNFAPLKYDQLEGNDAPDARRALGSSWGGAEAKASLSFSEIFPVFVGDGPLFSGNNIIGKATLELSPVSINGVGQVSLSPIAFLVFETGTSLGTGWTALGFRGLGINPEGNNESDIDLTPFGGIVWRVWGAGTFQFDMAALKPGEWHHVVFLATAKIEYKANTAASAQEAWLWEADSAENFNGAKFYGTYVLAYQMPLFINLAGIIVESEEWLGAVRDYAPMDTDGEWGSDFRIWQIGTVTNFVLTPKDSLAVLVQFKQKPDWTDETTRNRDFRTRDFDGSYWYFNRIALSYTHTF